ncbi:MAG: aspartyl protease [Patescibacteria group bacterium]
MGITNLRVSIANPENPRKSENVYFMVDSGAVYSVVDSVILKKLGIKPMSEKEFSLANGDLIKRKMGGALYQYGEEKGHAPVIFGEKGDSNLLGAVTLESMGLVLDPIKRRLLSLPMILGGLKNK